MRAQLAFKTITASAARSLAVERFPTNTTTRHHAVHRWFNFIAGFSPELVQGCIATLDHPEGNRLRLLDPFSGCGTAPVAARLAGAESVAYEPHPFFALISEAKANSCLYWSSLPSIHVAIGRGIMRRDRGALAAPPSVESFLGKLFRHEDLTALCSIRTEFAECGLIENPLAILILSRILDHCCLAATDGIYKAPTSGKLALTPKAASDKVFKILSEDDLEARAYTSTSHIYKSSSESMKELDDNSVDLVVTSPPYLNNFDFAEMTRMYLYFWGMASTWAEITDRVRCRLIVNTTTAIKGHKSRQDAYRSSLPDQVRHEADESVSKLALIRKQRAGKKEYDFLIYPYLSQMQAVLKECRRVMRSGAPFHMMVSDAALYGVHLPAPQWLSHIMRAVGFSDVQCELVRRRGHRWVLDKREGSVTGLGEYYVYGRVG